MNIGRLLMTKIIIGCDPDSDKSGISLYANGGLERLECMSLIDIYQLFKANELNNIFIELHIENLNGNSSSAFNHNRKMSQAVKFKVSESVGKCKQVQVEIERMAEHFGIKVIHHNVSSAWKKDKSQFELATKWKGRSNEDSRSAAYFGFLGCK